MTNIEAARSITGLASGTIAHLINDNSYYAIDRFVNNSVRRILRMPERTFAECENWMQVIEKGELIRA